MDGRLSQARQLFEEAAALARPLTLRLPICNALGCLGELRLVQTRHLSSHLRPHPGNLEPIAHLFHGARRLGAYPGGGRAALLQTGGKRHAQTCGVGSSDELFGIGSPRTFKPRGKGVIPLERA